MMVTFTFTPVPLLVTVSASSRLAAGEGEDEAIKGAAAVLSEGVTTTVTDTPGARPSAGADEAAPGDAWTTATSPCTPICPLVSHHCLQPQYDVSNDVLNWKAIKQDAVGTLNRDGEQ